MIDINGNKNLKKDYSGDIKLTAGTLSLSYPVSITYIPTESTQEEAESIEEASITEIETEKGSNVKFAIRVTSNGEEYASGSFIVSV